MEIYKNSSYSVAERVNDLLGKMTLEEKVGQMLQVNGRENVDDWVTEKCVGSVLHSIGEDAVRLQKLAQETRLGIPILFGIDAIHGHGFYEGATIFPTQISMSSSWNPDLLKRVAEITAVEVSLTGLHWTFSPVLCIARDSRWGRVGETFGEDPYLIGELAKAMIIGYQGKQLSDPFSILACAKHYVAYAETDGGRDAYEGNVTERKLRSIFLPPFKKAVEAGCGSFMAGYQSNDGVPCSANRWLLHDVLREEWGFEGIVVTDWKNLTSLHTKQKVAASLKEATEITVRAGNDMMMESREFYEHAVNLFKEGIIPMEYLNTACARILEIKFKLGLFDNKRFPDQDKFNVLMRCPEHVQAAYACALESMVLLKNDNHTLPISNAVQKIAIVGPCADDMFTQMGDWVYIDRLKKAGTLEGNPNLSTIVTLLAGVKNRSGTKVEITYEKGCDMLDSEKDDIPAAVKAAEASDMIIAAVGDIRSQYGEYRDRANLDLSGAQESLLKALKATGKPLVVVLLNSKPLSLPWVKENADAILEAWNPGMQGGNAIASILFGDCNPTGKLAISFPQHVGQLPVYYNQYPGWHGDKYVDMASHDPLFAFGYGLSYTSFNYSDLKLSSDKLGQNDTLTVSIDVQNTGVIEGTEIVQWYINDIYSSVTTPVKELKGFARVQLLPGEKKTVTLKLPVSSLALVNSRNEYIVEPGTFDMMVGSSSRDCDLLKALFEVVA